MICGDCQYSELQMGVESWKNLTFVHRDEEKSKIIGSSHLV